MREKINAVLIAPQDDVVTVIVDCIAGEAGRYLKNGKLIETVIKEKIPKYHKFAIRDIAGGDVVRKYGEVIGVATYDIRQGCHVHDHNIGSPATERADARGETQ